MKKSEQSKLRGIYDQIEDIKSQLEDLADEIENEDEEETLRTASETLDDTISTLDELDMPGGLHINITGANADSAIKVLEAMLQAAADGDEDDEDEEEQDMTLVAVLESIRILNRTLSREDLDMAIVRLQNTARPDD